MWWRGWTSFNEGGADCPPKPHTPIQDRDKERASMKGGRTAPRNSTKERTENMTIIASMKGGRTAPRNV